MAYRFHVSQLRRAWGLENDAIKKYLGDMHLPSNMGTKSRKRRVFSSVKKQLDEHFGAVTQRVSSFTSTLEGFCGKHTRFNSSSSEDGCDTSGDEVGEKGENSVQNQCKLPSHSMSSADRVSSCPYPSVSEEMTRLGLKNEMDSRPCPASDNSKCNKQSSMSSNRKRKAENLSGNNSIPHKLSKKDMVETDLLVSSKTDQKNVDLSMDIDSIRMFMMTWKEACRDNDEAEVSAFTLRCICLTSPL